MYLIKLWFNGIMKNYFGNVLLEKVVLLFLKECEDYGIDFKKFIYCRIGNYVKDLEYDLNYEEEMGIF